MKTDLRRFGSTQRDVLTSLVKHKAWSLSCGWLWDTHRGTEKFMENFVRRGLATRHYVPRAGAPGATYTEYRPTRAAKDIVARTSDEK